MKTVETQGWKYVSSRERRGALPGSWAESVLLSSQAGRTSPPQPLLAPPAKFKAGLNFHLVNSFVNKATESIYRVIGAWRISQRQQRLSFFQNWTCASWGGDNDYDYMIHSLYAVQWTSNSVDDHPFKRCNEVFLKAAIFPSLAGEEASCLVCGDVIMYSFTLSL